MLSLLLILYVIGGALASVIGWHGGRAWIGIQALASTETLAWVPLASAVFHALLWPIAFPIYGLLLLVLMLFKGD